MNHELFFIEESLENHGNKLYFSGQCSVSSVLLRGGEIHSKFHFGSLLLALTQSKEINFEGA